MIRVGMTDIRKARIGTGIRICLLLCALILINLAFFNYIKENEIQEQSGEAYLERDEYLFSDIFQDEEDYVEQIFRPAHGGLTNIKIRLALNYAGLKDDFVLAFSLSEGENVLQYEEVTREEIKNWRYYDLEVREKLDTDTEYSLKIQQLTGPKIENSDQYWISYVIFHGVRHVPENDPFYFYNGEEVEGEFEVCYLYNYLDSRLIETQIVANVIFFTAFATLLILKRRVKAGDRTKKVMAVVLYFALPVLAFISVESIAGNLSVIQGWNAVKNLLIYYLILILLSLCFSGFGVLSAVYLSGCAIVGLVQYFVLLFRGRVFTIQDIFAWKTAATVADRYIYAVDFPVFVNLMMVLFGICVCMQFRIKLFSFGKKGLFALGIMCVMGLIGKTQGGFLISTDRMNMWDLSANYKSAGVLLTLASQTQYLSGERPEGYSLAGIEEIMEGLGREEKHDGIVAENIILIMNESFADLEYIERIETNTEMLPYLHSMKENAVKGYLTVPVFGAGTSNTEYEVLTGNTMAFLAGGSTAYQMNVWEREYGMATILKEQNYTAIAAHPYMAGNWNRKAVYSHMGFDEFLSQENWGKMEIIRWCASDKAAYDKVIETYEDTESSLFLFLVTMQNHGGYATEYEDFQNTVELNYETPYPQAEQYLSLLQESDNAFRDLIEYFSEVEEPSMVIMFGDHQATIEDEFYEELFGKPIDELSFEEEQERYVTPFVIWTNYDIEEKDDIRMSTNYFGSYILDIGGLEMAPYNRFLLGLWNEIPIICPRGICTKEGIWYRWNELPEEYAELVEEYKMLQYNNVYDRKNRVDDFFTVG